MPLYEYECKSCDQVVEVLVRRQDEKPECPTCGNDQMERLLSVPAAPAVKGSGSRLPIAASEQSCGAPRCCGGGCQM